MTVSYRGDTRISVSQEDKECCYLDHFLKGKSLWPKIIVLKEEEERREKKRKSLSGQGAVHTARIRQT